MWSWRVLERDWPGNLRRRLRRRSRWMALGLVLCGHIFTMNRSYAVSCTPPSFPIGDEDFIAFRDARLQCPDLHRGFPSFAFANPELSIGSRLNPAIVIDKAPRVTCLSSIHTDRNVSAWEGVERIRRRKAVRARDRNRLIRARLLRPLC